MIAVGSRKYPLGPISRSSMQFPENCNYDTLLKQNHAPCRRERAPCDAAVAAGRCDPRVRNHTPPAAKRDRTAGIAHRAAACEAAVAGAVHVETPGRRLRGTPTGGLCLLLIILFWWGFVVADHALLTRWWPG